MAKKQLNIFLSASIPLENRNLKYWRTADVIAIRDSIIALTRVALPKYRLIWGGHPSITQLIAHVLTHLGQDVQKCVTLYQSLFFEKIFPLENERVAHIIKTENMGSLDESLQLMRERMIGDNEFYAGIFIGGMEGVEEEYSTFKSKHPQAKVFPVGSTGAAAKYIFDNEIQDPKHPLNSKLAYSSLFRDLLEI